MPQSWPRKLTNFPIILFAISVQYCIALGVISDPLAHFATSTQILYTLIAPRVLPFVMLAIPSIAIAGFLAAKRITTVLCLVPQQLLLYLSAGGSFEAIWLGNYADGTVKPHMHILVDQCPVILLAVFHTWAMALILRYGADND